MRRQLTLAVAITAFFSIGSINSASTEAGFVLSGGARWDANARVSSGNERSLVGGLRYSVSGGSYAAFRDQFRWNVLPSVADFQTAVQQAFSAWTSVDPVSGLGTSLNFVQDFGTSVVSGSGFGTLNANGAEIDLIAADAGVSGLGGVTAIEFTGVQVALTSGTQNYLNSVAITGVDLHLNSNANAVYTLDAFRRILTHELGHAIGLGDVDLGGTQFIDDNFSSAAPVATLTNSWASLVNPFDPTNSPGLSTFNIPSSTFALPGIDLLMESNGLGVGPTNPLSRLIPLTNDEYGMRQFLYPTISVVPEPASLILFSGLLLRFTVSRRRTWFSSAVGR
jgi:hypothetical protein